MTATVPPDDTESCPCGSPWWRLEQDPDSAPATPSVTIDREGKITGWCGRPVCVECGEPWAPTRDRLSVVDDSPGGVSIDGGVLDLQEVRDQLVTPDPPALVEAARQAKTPPGAGPFDGRDLYVPPELDAIPHPPRPDIPRAGSFGPVQPRPPRVRHVVLAYDRPDFMAWRGLHGQGLRPEQVIPVFTNDEGGGYRLRGIELTDADVIHRWTRCGDGAFINEAMNELAFASRNRTQP